MMNTQNRIMTVLILVAAVLAVPARVAALEGQLGILTPETLAGDNPATGAPWRPGDVYRLAFFTSARITAESADISTYNSFVQELANATTVYDIGADDGVTWKVIGSTSSVDAIDNTSTNWTDDSPGDPIYLLDGRTVVANNYKDLWDGQIRHIINLTEQGVELVHWPWTGTYLDGTAAPGHSTSYGALGSSGQVHQGRSDKTTEWIWRTWTGEPSDEALHMYALSDPLVILADPNAPDVDAGGDWVTWSGRPVTLDATVVNNDPGNPPADLTYAWTVDDDSLANPELTIILTGADREDVMVKITKTAPTGDATVVTMTLAANNAGSGLDDVRDTVRIKVYDDACHAAIDRALARIDSTDFNADCVTNLADFAVMAANWLSDATITAPIEKP